MQIHIKDGGGRIVLTLEIVGKDDSEGWLNASLQFDYDGFTAKFPFSMMLNDLYPFIDQLKTLYNTLMGDAEFSNIENNVRLHFLTTGLGQVSIQGTLRHNMNQDLKTLFVIDTDQTFLPPLIAECNEILNQYQPQ